MRITTQHRCGSDIRRHVLAATKVHGDDTPIPVLAPGSSTTKTARLWTYVRDDRPTGNTAQAAICFAYSPDRQGIHPQTHLTGLNGVLALPATQAFQTLAAKG